MITIVISEVLTRDGLIFGSINPKEITGRVS